MGLDWMFVSVAAEHKAGHHRDEDEVLRYTMERFGGASRDRTDDLIVANDALSQLSYSPEPSG
jgi:hypothetical protein